MFGYVSADFQSLSSDQQKRYRSYYCGLCRCIGQEAGTLSRLSLTYDLTFLAILLSSLYEPEEISGVGRCAVHPFKKNSYQTSDVIAYSASMNIALAYHKCRDDWDDERRLPAHILSAILMRRIPDIAETYPRQWNAMDQCIRNLTQMEQKHCYEPDRGAAYFGKLMEELFIWKEDRWSEQLRTIGKTMGQFIYLMDAILDLKSDRKANRYNPFKMREDTIDIFAAYHPVLQILIGECTEAFEQLPLVKDLDLLRNILYSGIWLRWQQSQLKEPNYV